MRSLSLKERFCVRSVHGQYIRSVAVAHGCTYFPMCVWCVCGVCGLRGVCVYVVCVCVCVCMWCGVCGLRGVCVYVYVVCVCGLRGVCVCVCGLRGVCVYVVCMCVCGVCVYVGSHGENLGDGRMECG